MARWSQSSSGGLGRRPFREYRVGYSPLGDDSL